MVADAWKAEKRRYVKISSYAAYVQLVNNYVVPFFAGADGDGMPSAGCAQAFADSLLARGLSVKTVKDSLLVFGMVCRYGASMGAWPPVDMQVHFPSYACVRREVQVLPKTDQRRLLEYLTENFTTENLGILICLHSGLRIGEVCGLQWRDLDMSEEVIRVTKTVQRIYIADGAERQYYVSVDSPKSASSLRDIPISHDLMRIIRPLKKVFAADNYVVSNASEPMEPRLYRAYYYRLLKRLEIRPVRFHALRHSFASRCIESRCDYKTVSVILGHSSISTTMDLYVHPGYDDKKRCIDKLSKVLKG